MEIKILLLLQLLLILIVSEVFGGWFDSLYGKSEEESESKEDVAKIKCKRTCYRSYNGSCNNLKNPLWGTPETLFSRLFDCYSYEDGKCEMPHLTNARKISLDFVHITGVEDPIWTLYVVEFGQMLAHDIALSSSVSQTGSPECSCVKGKLTKKRSESDGCAPIEIPKWDPYFTPEEIECFEFVRTRSTCKKIPNKPAQQYNSVTSFIDCSPVYGNSEKEAKSLRKFKYGMLDYVIIDGRMYPPQAKDKKTCNNAGASKPLCLVTGDFRANQNPHIALLQIILLRYHNHIAKALCKMNSHWDDEKCFQEARRIVIACFQHITYYEFLPILLGEDNMKKHDLIASHPKGHVKGYNNKINPSTINEHATVAYRGLHSAIVGHLKMYDDNRKQHGIVRLSDTFNNVSLLADCDTELFIAIGAGTQRQQLVDRLHDPELTLHLFRKQNERLGVDLYSIDIQRARDHGTGYYSCVLEKCGFKRPKSFDDLEHISVQNRKIIKRHYDSVHKVELRVAGQLETLVKGTLTGPTYLCIMIEQFYRLKYGDAYWYEFEQECSFTKEQLKEIRKSKISSLMCHFGGMFSIQPKGFEWPSYYNKIVPCCDLPVIDLTKWQEDYIED